MGLIKNRTKGCYILKYGNTKIDVIMNVILEEVICHIFYQTEESKEYKDPDVIILPNGLKLSFNPYIANCFLAKGTISEKEFIEMSLISNNN